MKSKSMLKRSIDLVAAVCGLTITMPVILVCVAAIRLSSPGPAIFRQVRVGKDGRYFVCLKLRTMFIDTRNAASHEIAAQSVTNVGSFLRKTKLDELPQLINVLRGEMSLVGPRPCLPSQTELVRLRTDAGVYNLRPGITGLAQIRGIDMSNPARLCAFDRKYADTVSVIGDLKILAATLFGKGQGDRVKK